VAAVSRLERGWRDLWATGVGLLAYFGGKALAESISRYGLYAGATVAVLAVIVAIAPKLIARLQGRPEAQR
jgi:membrane protein DedA with SNARE-associated domain